MTSSPICESRLPVGSSASRMRGRPTMARAMATRCCWPPESCDGKWWMRALRPTRSSAASASLRRSRVRHPAVEQRNLHVVEHAQVGDQVEGLEDEADLLVADRGERAIAIAGDRRPVDLHRAPGRRVEQPDQVEQRALAAAGRPHDRDELPFADVEVDVGERHRLDAIGAVDLLDAVAAESCDSLVPLRWLLLDPDFAQVHVVLHVRDDQLRRLR